MALAVRHHFQLERFSRDPGIQFARDGENHVFFGSTFNKEKIASTHALGTNELVSLPWCIDGSFFPQEIGTPRTQGLIRHRSNFGKYAFMLTKDLKLRLITLLILCCGILR